MNAAIEARFAVPGDAAPLARMLHDFNTEFGDPSPGVDVIQKRVSAFIENGWMTYFLGGPGPDGFAQVSFRPTIWSDQPVAYIEELYVVPDRRRHGIGRVMMEAIFAEAHRRKACGVELVTGEDDLGARALYERFGLRNETEGPQNSRSLFYELRF